MRILNVLMRLYLSVISAYDSNGRGTKKNNHTTNCSIEAAACTPYASAIVYNVIEIGKYNADRIFEKLKFIFLNSRSKKIANTIIIIAIISNKLTEFPKIKINIIKVSRGAKPLANG